MAQLNFDASQIAPNTGAQDPVPAGWYVAQIDESEMKPTRDGAGAYLQLRFSIMEPASYANRKVFARLNLKNANPQAQEIAYSELSAICHSTGVMQIQDSQQLHGIPLKIKLKIRPAKDGYDASNELSNYKNVNESVEMVSDAAGGGAPAGGGGVPQGFNSQQPAQQPQQAPQQQPAQQPWQGNQQAPQQAPQQPWQSNQQPAQQPAQQPWQGNNQQQAPQQAPQEQAPQQPQGNEQAPQQSQQPAQGNGMPPWAQGQN